MLDLDRADLSHIPPNIRRSLGQFVEGLIDYEPLAFIQQVNLFGSLAEGRWNPSSSDIDVAAIIDETREKVGRFPLDPVNFSYQHQADRRPTGHQLQLGICGLQFVEDLKLWGKFQLITCLPSDFEGILTRVNDGRGPLSAAIKRGIIIYQTPGKKPI